jgi:flagellar basal-body rod modification protein FlgD
MNTNAIGGSTAADAMAGTATQKKPTERETFLQLLVAQIRHQNPLNPADGVQFLTQLAQFSELEQMMEIRNEIAALRAAIEADTADPQTAATEQTSPATTPTSGDSNV